MISSLTGFGNAEATDEVGRVSVEIKSVNNRYLQLDIRVPYGYSWADGFIRSFVGNRVSRGKVSIILDIVDYTPSQEMVINKSLINQFVSLRKELQQADDSFPLSLSLDGLCALPGIMKVSNKGAEFEEKTWERIKIVLEKALEAFLNSRNREGLNLASDIQQRKGYLVDLVNSVEGRLPAFRQNFISRFSARIKELAGQTSVDPSRLSAEIALWTDRSDITEEINRLRSHLEELELSLKRDNAVGRRLDFLLQEINREANTIGNKIGDLMIIQQVIDIKCEVEKIREQIQNIE